MANALYPLWKQELLKATTNTNLSSTTVKVALLTSTYTYSSAHQFRSSWSGTIVLGAAGLATKTFTNGNFGAANFTWSAVAGGTTFNAIGMYVDTGVAGTDVLVAYLDTSITNLPVTSNGGDIIASWNASGIFGL